MTVALAAAIVLGATSPAVAATTPDDAGAIAATVTDATPAALQAAEVPAQSTAGGAFTSTGDDSLRVVIPARANGEVVLSAETPSGNLFSVSVSTGTSTSTTAELADDGSVVYDGNGSTDQTIQPMVDGFRIHTVLNDGSASGQYVYNLTLPTGARLVPISQIATPEGVPANSSGGVFVLDDTGQMLLGFPDPWATDADGRAVPTHYEVLGTQLIQVVDHKGGNYTYPIVADPYAGHQLIQSVKWVSHAEGLTMEVTPTAAARGYKGGYAIGVAGWDEIMARKSGVTRNKNGMRDQFICHEQIVAVRAPNKPTWNIDEWRPDVGYLQTVNASCNPGGSKWFD